MSSEPLFRCPACHARQTVRNTCRRCGADLMLVARAHRYTEWLLTQFHIARDSNDHPRQQQLKDELLLLAPERLALKRTGGPPEQRESGLP